MALDLTYWLQPPLQDPRTYALFFLLGQFTVASLSDIRRMSAQQEFVEIWVFAFLVVFSVDLYLRTDSYNDRFIFKWACIAILSLLSYRGIGLLFKLEWGDVAAIAAACGILAPLMVPIFFLILIACNLILVPVLRNFGKGNAYPFMPVVTAATLIALPVASYLQSLNLIIG